MILEVEKGITTKPQLKSIVDAQENRKIQIISTSQEETILLMGQLRAEGALGKGEISLIGIAKEREAIFISDDKGATNKAKSKIIFISLNVSGIYKVFRNHQLKRVNPFSTPTENHLPK